MLKSKDAPLQLQRAAEEIGVAFGQMATEPVITVDDWEVACEALREVLNAATAELVKASHARLLAAELERDQPAAE